MSEVVFSAILIVSIIIYLLLAWHRHSRYSYYAHRESEAKSILQSVEAERAKVLAQLEEMHKLLSAEEDLLQEKKKNTARELQIVADAEEEHFLRNVKQMYSEKSSELRVVQSELDKLKDTKRAAIEAARREKLLAQEPDTYKIQLSEDEIHDIEFIDSIRNRLYHPETLGKFVWSNFYQKKVKSLCSRVLGNDTVCGIYKITDLLTTEVYIGQAKNIASRWQSHIKCGCGATPTGAANALYAAMSRDGLENFTFELLETCRPEELNEKEAYFIEVYSADTMGLNSKKGNTK